MITLAKDIDKIDKLHDRIFLFYSLIDSIQNHGCFSDKELTGWQYYVDDLVKEIEDLEA
jgi:hypothetical protein